MITLIVTFYSVVKLSLANFKLQRTENGFALIELLVVIVIIGLLSLAVFTGHRSSDKLIGLQRSTYKMAQDIRWVQSMAMTAQEFQEEVPRGYGIYIDLSESNQEYLLFADFGNNDERDVRVVELEKEIYISRILAPGYANVQRLKILFSPPDPKITINIGITNSPLLERREASIFLTYEGGSEKIVNINKVGLVDIE